MRNRKGIETGLSDFYATIVIFLIILVFFFVLKIKVDKMQYSVTGDDSLLEDPTLALVVAQTSVNTSLGTMTIGEFIPLAINNPEREQELQEKMQEVFTPLAQNDGIGVEWELHIIHEEENELWFIDNTYDVMARGTSTYETPSIIIIPLQDPGNTITLEIRGASTHQV